MHPKSVFRQFGLKFKTLADLLENLHSRNLEGVEWRSNIDILQYFIENLNLDKLVLKLEPCRIYLKFVHETIFEDAHNKSYINILILHI